MCFSLTLTLFVSLSMFCYSETKELKETKTVDDSVKKLVPVEGKFQVAGLSLDKTHAVGLTVTVDKDASPNSDWFDQSTWDDLMSYTTYFRKLQWMLTTKIIYTEDMHDKTKLQQEKVLSCGLFVTRDSVMFQLKLRMTTDRDSYESTQAIHGRLYLTELHNKESNRRIYSDGGYVFDNPNHLMLKAYLRQFRKRCHCQVDKE